MARLDIGLRIPSGEAPDIEQLRRFVLRAEELGFHSIWAGDHVFHHTDVMQPLDLLSWVAALTSRVGLGTSVVLAAYLNPVLLAKSAATVDYLSGGRLTLGVSIGGSVDEYASLGVPMSQRVGRLLESVEVMRRLWREDDVSHAGRYFQLQHANLRPKPAQASIPVFFAGQGPRMLARIPQVADGWVAGSHYSVEDFMAGLQRVRQGAEAIGRNPDSIAIAKVHDVSVHRDRREARRRADRHWQRYYGPRHDVEVAAVFGEPDECAEQLAVFKGTPAPEMTLILEPSSLELEELELLREVTARLA